MSRPPGSRPPAREAGPELLVLSRWEEFTGWLLDHTAKGPHQNNLDVFSLEAEGFPTRFEPSYFGGSPKWPKSARFTLTQRIENHALDVTEMLVQARYEPGGRKARLEDANLRLERMRHLLRLACGAQVESPKGFESALRGIDEAGRMLHGWRKALEGGPKRDGEASP
jgi:hypothetical protein